MKHNLLIVFFAFFGGCSLLKGKAAERAGFIPEEIVLEEHRERAPFNGVWADSKSEFSRRKAECNKLFIKPVRTDFLLKKGWWSNLNALDRASYQDDVQELASFFREQLIAQIEAFEGNRWEVTNEPDDSTLIFEYALTEVIATKVHLNALGTGLGFFVPGGGLVSQTAGGSIAFEAQVYDGRDGALLIAYADRETDKVSIVTLRDYQFYAHARQSIRDWAEQLAELANTEEDVQVWDSFPFTLSLW